MKRYTKVYNARWRKLTLIVEPEIEHYFIKRKEAVEIFIDDEDDMSEASVDVHRGNCIVFYTSGEVYVFKDGERVEPSFR